MKSPLVSICIPTYNRAGIVKKAIDSALGQSYSNIEVLVVDNASEDDIESVIRRYNDDRLKLFKNVENLGQFGNFNRCIELSKGKYVHILHSDDYIDQTFTENCIRLFETHPDLAMTFSSMEIIKNGESKKSAYYVSDHILRAPEGFRQLLLQGNFIPCPSVMFKRNIFSKIEKFSMEYPFAGDFYQWLKISRKNDIGFVANATVFYSAGENNSVSYEYLVKNPLGYLDIIKIFFQIITDLGDERIFYQKEMNIAIRRYLYSYLNTGISDLKIMRQFSPLIFIGFGLIFWTLLGSKTIKDRKQKINDFFCISIIGFYLIFPRPPSHIIKIILLKFFRKIHII